MTSNIHRFLSRRERRQKSTPDVVPDVGTFADFFLPDEEARKKKLDKDEEKAIKTILARLQSAGITMFNEANVDYALRSKASQGNLDDAFRLLILFEDTYEGLVKSYNPNTKLLGAENRSGVTCYLDALLFAMFARLDSFEAMLYNAFEDPPRKKLAGLMRLWVNMLRDGKLITVDITKQLQEALAECGWESACKLMQQDTSEAFTFITGQLELPLLTLKMDLYHTGKEEPDDDHRFVNERLLEVAILSEPVEGSEVITLEDCLENYFNNRIEVKRHMEKNRSNTLRSKRSIEREHQREDEKSSAMHIETVEFGVGEVVESPLLESPDVEEGSSTPVKSPMNKLRPGLGRSRADSIFSQRRIATASTTQKAADDPDAKSAEPQRKASIRTEVLMPAWQFFKLLPWYTDNVPTSDAQVAAHFSHKRPVLGIALKRYQVSNSGNASRLGTYVDIPLEIAVPAFVSDDNIGDDSPLVGNFKLVLQSVVCHRGSSVNSGHYVSLVRGQAANAKDRGSFESRPSSPYSDEEADPWMLFDDLARDRVTYVNIDQKLKEECPYLLFYQVQPIDDLPPTYEESCSRVPSDVSISPEKPKILESCAEGEGTSGGPEILESYAEGDIQDSISDTIMAEDLQSPTSPNGLPAGNTEAVDWSTSRRTSLDANTFLDERGRQSPQDTRGRSSMSSNRSSGGGRRLSAVFDDTSVTSGSVKGASIPSTPLDETRSSFLGLPVSRRGSKVGGKTKSRPSSQGAEDRTSRFGINFGMSKISMGRSPSRNDLSSLGKTTEEEGEVEQSRKPLSLNTDTSQSGSPTLPPTRTPTRSGSIQDDKESRHSSFPSVTGSVGSLGDAVPVYIPTRGSTDNLNGKKNWKEKMEMKRDEKRDEKSKAKGKGHHHSLSGRKKKGTGAAGEVPDRECIVM